MKGLLNVLYRKILYKIPLKFLLLLLAIFGLLFACNYIHGYNYVYNNIDGRVEYKNLNPGFNDFIINGDICITTTWDVDPRPQVRNLDHTIKYKDLGSVQGIYGGLFCTNEGGFSIYRPFSYSQRKGFVIETLSGQMETCPICTPQYTSEECQTEYGLVESGALISCETDLNSCISNTSGFNDLLNNCSNNLNACNLSLSSCLNNNCPTTSGDISWSSLFINDIQHIGGPSIYIGIPEEIERDYSYVDDDMYINVDGYNVDYDKITNIIDTQNYKPTTEDFNYIVSSVIPLFVPGLVIILFLYWIFRFIKKIF